jgi:hypothetical protein
MDIRVHIICINGGITPEIELGKREPVQCEPIPKEESIYLISQKGWKINPFISIGAYGGTGLGIRGQFWGSSPPDKRRTGLKRSGSSHLQAGERKNYISRSREWRDTPIPLSLRVWKGGPDKGE